MTIKRSKRYAISAIASAYFIRAYLLALSVINYFISSARAFASFKSITPSLFVSYSASVAVSTTALPFVFVSAGIVSGLFYLGIFCFILILIHLMYAEVIIKTGGEHRFPGFARIYLGEVGFWLASLTSVFGLLLVLTVYLILSASFFSLILPINFGVSDTLKILIFWFFSSAAIFLGVRRIALSEFLITSGIVLIAVLLFIFGGAHFDKILSTPSFSLKNIFLPYGVILFSLMGRVAIPTIINYFQKIEPGSRTSFVKKSIILGTLIPAFVYLLFIFGVLGLSGAVSEDAVEVRTGNNYGVFTVASISNSGLNLENSQSITLAPNATVSLAGNIKLKVIDNSTYLKFYPVKESGAAPTVSAPVAATNMSDAIQAVADYFSGAITKDEAMGIVSIIALPMPVPTPPMRDMENITKIDISPGYGNSRLQPGESKSMKVAVRNKDNRAVAVRPRLVIPPYSEYMMETEWITITPESVEIPAGGSQRFTINISVPKNASTGYYNGQVVFTDEVIPVSYPEPVPNYIHYFSLSIDVWALPKIQITPSYINDQIEAGKEYDYEVNLKNTGDEAIAINPIIGSDVYYGGPYGTSTALTDDAITITAPQNVPANTTEVVRIHVSVPPEARGYYSGWIDLGIDDPAVRQGEGRVNLNINIWTAPTVPFVKNFSLREAASITIDVTGSSYQTYPYPVPYPAPVSVQGVMTREPSFEVSLEGVGGNVELNLTKKVIKGSVSIGSGSILPGNNEVTYQDMNSQYIETYKANVSAGNWSLKVLPRNTQTFDYTITVGE